MLTYVIIRIIIKEVHIMPMKPKEMVKLLKRNGFVKVSQKGSHLKMYSEATNRTTVIPMHSRELKYGMQEKILKEAGLKEGNS